MKKISLVLPLLFLASACNQQAPLVNINGHVVKVQIAATDQTRQQGLSGREVLADDAGMLFVFDQPGTYPFWMKGMKFPLDFIWILNHKVVEITPDVPVETDSGQSDLTQYSPSEPVDSVLEVNAGYTASNNIRVGDDVKIPTY
jgi:uncharacterized membrane protein (UPF0127 family)